MQKVFFQPHKFYETSSPAFTSAVAFYTPVTFDTSLTLPLYLSSLSKEPAYSMQYLYIGLFADFLSLATSKLETETKYNICSKGLFISGMT